MNYSAIIIMVCYSYLTHYHRISINRTGGVLHRLAPTPPRIDKDRAPERQASLASHGSNFQPRSRIGTRRIATSVVPHIHSPVELLFILLYPMTGMSGRAFIESIDLFPSLKFMCPHYHQHRHNLGERVREEQVEQ